MQILHVTPHLGGGIAPALIGIVEVIPAKHVVLSVHKTSDLKSIKLIDEYGLSVHSLSDFFDCYCDIQNFDFIILHYWNTEIWSELLPMDDIFFSGRVILLSHQAYPHIGRQILEIEDLFSCIVQSGFDNELLPKNWFLVPTCKSNNLNIVNNNQINKSAIYFGTLSFKKVTLNFFELANRLTNFGIELSLYGNENDNLFTTKMINNKNNKIFYRGYSADIQNQMRGHSFFFYPLRENHYGTTENSLLEAMSSGLIPIVQNNRAESLIIGDELMPFCNLEFLISSCDLFFKDDNPEYRDLSFKFRNRALNLTSPQARRSVWDLVLSQSATVTFNLNTLAMRIELARTKFPANS